MAARRTITAMTIVSALTLLGVPAAATAQDASTGVATGVATGARWYEGRTGTVQWAIGAEFMEQLDESGAVLNVCSAAKVAVDKASGISIVTMPVHGNSVIQLGGSQAGVDATTDCLVTVSGNGTSVELKELTFGVSSAYESGISATIADDYADLGSGARTRLPKKAALGKVKATSPVIVSAASFADILRGQRSAATGTYDGPVPTMTSEQVNLGIFRLVLKVKTASGPTAGNEEG